jgi:predicted nucleic acid-binding protein
MRLLISDANILIDMEAGALMDTLFQLPMLFGIPDLLYYEEIERGYPGLDRLGLQIMEVDGEFVKYAAELTAKYRHALSVNHGRAPGHNDYLALALAKQKSCTLLTGDANLRWVATEEQVTVMGTIGLLCAMVENQLLTVDDALRALDRMKERNRWLPWPTAEKKLNGLRSAQRA